MKSKFEFGFYFSFRQLGPKTTSNKASLKNNVDRTQNQLRRPNIVPFRDHFLFGIKNKIHNPPISPLSCATCRGLVFYRRLPAAHHLLPLLPWLGLGIPCGCFAKATSLLPPSAAPHRQPPTLQPCSLATLQPCSLAACSLAKCSLVGCSPGLVLRGIRGFLLL